MTFAPRSRFRLISLCVLCTVLLSGVLRPPLAHADTPDEQFTFATGLYNQKLWSLAAENLRKFLEANPKHDKAKIAAYQLGAALYRATNTKGDIDYGAAATAYERAITQYPDPKLTAAARYELGDAYFNLKQYDKAATTYTQFLQSTPPADQAAEAHYSIGESYFALNKPAEARAAYEKVVAQHSTSRPAPYAQLALGLLAEDAKQFGTAATAFKAVIDRYPKSEIVAETRLRMANALLALKRYDEARNAYQASLKDPAAAEWKTDALLGLGDVQFATKDWAGAATTFTQILGALKPDDTRRAALQLRLADSRYNAKEYDLAIAAYAPLATNTNQQIAANALYFSAASQQALKRHTEAAAAYRKLLDTFPQSDKAPRAALRMGDAYADAKDAGRAAEAYQLVLTKYAKSDAAKEAREALVELAGEVAGGPGGGQGEALEKVLRALPAGPATSNAQLRLAQAAFGRSDWAKASQLAQSALAAKPDAATSENALYLMASAQLRAGKPADASTNFRRQLTSHPQGKLAGQARLGLTWALLDAQKWADAETAARAAVTALAPKPGKTANASLHNQARLALGEALLRNNKAKDAAPIFAALAGSADKEIAAQSTYGAAMAFEGQKQWSSAASNWGKYAALSAEPATKARAYFQQGQALVKAKNGTAALAAFDKAVAADPKGEVGAQALYESAWTAHDLKQAGQEATRWQRLATEFPESKFAAEASLQQGETLFTAKSWSEAAAAYRVVTERHAQSEAAPLAWYKLGSSLYNLKSWSEAAAAFDKAAAAKSSVALESSYWAGESQVQANNLAAARTHFDAFIKGVAAGKNISDDVKALVPAARLGVGRALAAANDWTGAAAAYEAGLNGAQGSLAAELGFHFGEALAQQNKNKEAATQFLKVVTRYGNSEWAPRAQWGAAEATEKSGDKATAIELYRALAARQPASELTTRAQEKLKALGADGA